MGAQTRSQVRLHPSYTHTYTNATLLDSWSISRDITIPLVFLCVHRDAPIIPLGSLCIHRDAPSQKTPIKMAPSTFFPHPRFSPTVGVPGNVFIPYILQKTVRLSVSARQVRGSILQNFWSPCCLPVSCCLATSLVQFDRARVVFSHPGSLCFLEAWKQHSYRPTPRDLGLRGASIVRMWMSCGLSCLVGLNSDLYRLCSSLHCLGTLGLSWRDNNVNNNKHVTIQILRNNLQIPPWVEENRYDV